MFYTQSNSALFFNTVFGSGSNQGFNRGFNSGGSNFPGGYPSQNQFSPQNYFSGNTPYFGNTFEHSCGGNTFPGNMPDYNPQNNYMPGYSPSYNQGGNYNSDMPWWHSTGGYPPNGGHAPGSSSTGSASGSSSSTGSTSTNGSSTTPTAPGGITYADEFAGRVAAHDVLDNGNMNGTIYLQVLLNPNNPDRQAFLDTPQDKQLFMQMFEQTLAQNHGQINGSVERQAVENNYYKGTGVQLQGLASAPLTPADTSKATIYKNLPSMTDPNQLTAQEKNSGLSANDLTAYALWGHAQMNGPGGVIENPSVKTFINQDATQANNPNSFDYPLINSSSGTLQFTQNIENSSNPANALNQAFINTMGKVFQEPPNQVLNGK